MNRMQNQHGNLVEGALRQIMLWGICLLLIIGFSTGTAFAASKRTSVVTTASSYSEPFEPARATDGLVTDASRWYCGADGDKWLKMDLGVPMWIDRWSVTHLGSEWSRMSTTSYNTYEFKVQKSDDGNTWTDVDQVTGNMSEITDRTVSQFKARYVRLYITKGNQENNRWASVRDFSVYGKDYTVSFDARGGTETAALAADGNALISAPTAPSKADGSTFTGWYKDLGCTIPWDFTVDRVAGNTVLYAGWEQYLITLPTSPKGTVQATVDGILVTGPVPAGSTVVLTAQPAPGYLPTPGYPEVVGATLTGNTFVMPQQNVTVNMAFQFMLPPLTIVADSMPDGVEGSPYVNPIAAIGGSGSYSYTLVSGPVGLATMPPNQLVWPLPTVGTHQVTVTATDLLYPAETVTKTLTLKINPAQLTGLTVVPPTKLEYQVGEAFDAAGMVVTGNYVGGFSRALAPTEYSVAGFDSTKAAVTQRVTVTSREFSGSFQVSIWQPRSVEIVTPPRLSYRVGETMNTDALVVIQHDRFADRRITATTLEANGLSVTVPHGRTLTLADSGTDFRVVWADWTTSTSVGVLNVSPLPIILTTESLPITEVDQTYSVQLTAQGGTGSYRYTVKSGSLPDGITLSESGLLSGAARVAGDSQLVILATDSKDSKIMAEKAYTLVVNPLRADSLTATPPTKLDYLMGESFDAAGMVVTAHFTNGTERVLDASEYTISGFNSATVTQSHEVRVNAYGQYTALNVSVHQIPRVEILTQPRLVYTAGETLNLSGLRVLQHDWYEDRTVGYSELAANGLTIEPAEGTVLDTSFTGRTISIIWSIWTTSTETRALTVQELPPPSLGAISGRVTDDQGSPLFMAFIEAVGSGGRYTTFTDPTGHYSLMGLQQGAYQVSAQMPGHESDSRTGVAVNDEQNTENIDFQLTAVPFSADIITFNVAGQAGTTEIDTDSHTVRFHMPYGSDVTALEPAITVSTGAAITPGSGSAQDFSNAVSYTVTNIVAIVPPPPMPAAMSAEALEEQLDETPSLPAEEQAPSNLTDSEETPDEAITDGEQSEEQQDELQDELQDEVQNEQQDEVQDVIQDELQEQLLIGQGIEAGSVGDPEGEKAILISPPLIKVQVWTAICTVDPEPAESYTVTIAQLTGGTITATPSEAEPGTRIVLTVTPNAGMRLSAGTLKYSDGSDHAISGTTFVMPEANVTVSAEFVRTATGGGGGRNTTAGGNTQPPVAILPDEEIPLGFVKFYEPYVNGYSDGTFRPQEAVTRAQLAVMFARILKLNTEGPETAQFTDLGKDHWAYGSVQATTRIGMFAGYADGRFDPDKPMTRAEMAAVIAKYWAYSKVEVDGSATPLTDISGHWAETQINQVYNAGVIKGFEDGTFRPDTVTRREQAVVIINTLIQRPLLAKDTASFKDVPTSHWAYGNIEAASSSEKTADAAGNGAAQ